MKKRLQEFMSQEGLTAARLAEIVGVQPSAISHILSGRNYPRFDFLHNLLKAYPNINARWLLLGDGDINILNDLRMQTTDVQSEQAPYPKQQETIPQKENNKTDDPVATLVNDGNCLNNKVKAVDKVIIFYADGTFSMYENK